MNGTIETRHLFTHGLVIVRNFGVRAYVRCLLRVARHPKSCTFLGSIY
jgi:hypothetical protein